MAIRINPCASSPDNWHVPSDSHLCYEIEVTSDMIDEEGMLLDQLIGFGIETLNASVLRVRIVAITQSRAVGAHHVIAGRAE